MSLHPVYFPTKTSSHYAFLQNYPLASHTTWEKKQSSNIGLYHLSSGSNDYSLLTSPLTSQAVPTTGSVYFFSPLPGIPFSQLIHGLPQFLQISDRISLTTLYKTAPHLSLSSLPCYFSS